MGMLLSAMDTRDGLQPNVAPLAAEESEADTSAGKLSTQSASPAGQRAHSAANPAEAASPSMRSPVISPSSTALRPRLVQNSKLRPR